MTHLDPVRRSFSALIAPLILASAVLLAAAGCGGEATGDGIGDGMGGDDEIDSLVVVDASLDRPVNPSLAAVRFVIRNGTSSADVLVGASSPDGDASIHRSDIDDQGRSVMNPVDRLDVPARSSVVFAPGGLHVMLTGITRELEVGDTVSLTLELEDHGPLEVEVPVVEPLGSSTSDSEADHDHEALAPPSAPSTAGALR